MQHTRHPLLTKMSLRELLDLYRTTDMRVMAEFEMDAYSGVGTDARIGENDWVTIIEDHRPEGGNRPMILFAPRDHNQPSVSLFIDREKS